MPPEDFQPNVNTQGNTASDNTGQPLNPQPDISPVLSPLPGNTIAPTPLPSTPKSDGLPSAPPMTPTANSVINNVNNNATTAASPPPNIPFQAGPIPNNIESPVPVAPTAPIPALPIATTPVTQNPSTLPTIQNPNFPTATQPPQIPFGSVDGVDPSLVAKENIYTEICSQIIIEQEKIIGSLAIEQANQVVGLTVDPATYHCTVTGSGSAVIDSLIEQYRNFFGHAAVEVCKEAAARFISKLPAEELPTLLR
jgi:hypothetical protein